MRLRAAQVRQPIQRPQGPQVRADQLLQVLPVCAVASVGVWGGTMTDIKQKARELEAASQAIESCADELEAALKGGKA